MLKTAPALVAAVAAMAATADLATKSWAAANLQDREIALPAGLVLRESRNSGAAFSFATSHTELITVFTIAVLAVIAVHARRLTGRRYAVALGLLAGGAAGNLVDRLLRAPGPFRGAVVDWIDFGWWPSFNLADSAIMCGAALLVLHSLRQPPGAEHAEPAVDGAAQ